MNRMNRMADTVIKQMDESQREEDEKIRRYELEKELRERLEDEKAQKRMKSGSMMNRLKCGELIKNFMKKRRKD